MAPTPSTALQPLKTRGRSARKTGHRASSAESPSAAEPPLKKQRRYVPGGPGGGGRYVAADGTEVLVGGGGPGGYNYTGPRRRIARENTTAGVQPVAYPRPRRESRRERVPTRPRFSSAAAAAAAVVHGDGFKPREERGWEEFHPDLEIYAKLPVFSADEVDGVKRSSRSSSVGFPEDETHTKGHMTGDTEAQMNGNGHRTPSVHDEAYNSASPRVNNMTPRRRPGRPPRRFDSLLKGIGTPDVPKLVPPPGFNPKEKLTLPKPSFRIIDPFAKFEDREDYVNQSMAKVGYQEGEMYNRPERELIRVTEGNIEDDLAHATNPKSDGEGNSAVGGTGVGRVEYDMDEQDTHWLEAFNATRKAEGVEPIKSWIFEVAMTKIEKEWYALEKRIPKPNPKPPQTHRPRSSSAAAVNGELAVPGEEQDSKCAICDDGDCENTNAIVFCDGCDLAVHQECYGVPFIPEGQWLCRKCQLIGRGTPTCIFCPNTDGAFKQTNASRWSHLLCAIWIPEVSIGNSTFMEPVMDVEKVPRQRWKLICYICRQKMGACIQCGNKNCYQAFHVTCARRARLFLKMKSTHGGPANLDASVLKAFCDKHVPADWRREHDTDNAIVQQMDYYRYTMRGKLWADSQQAALTSMAPPPQDPFVTEPETPNPKITLKINPKDRNKNPTPKIVWKLPSGAFVIPQALFNSIESSLARFMLPKRKVFAAEMCKYWTLKREARRGAALLKRFQVQMEPFTSIDLPRRNFVGMGAAGGVRLQRRIDFADALLEDVDKLRQLCAKIHEREHQKLEDAKILKDLVDTIYFPIPPLLSPILERAQVLDIKQVFKRGFSILEEKIDNRAYLSVHEFCKDFGAALNNTLISPAADDASDAEANGESQSKSTISDLKQKKHLAKRIIKAVQGQLQDAVRKECEIHQRSSEKELQQLDAVLEESVASRPTSNSGLQNGNNGELDEDQSDLSADLRSSRSDHAEMEWKVAIPEDPAVDPVITHLSKKARTSPASDAIALHQQLTGLLQPLANGINGSKQMINGTNGIVGSAHTANNDDDAALSTLSMSTENRAHPVSKVIPWYMEHFRPKGTTVEEEHWSGRELVRGMSEDLTDMDEEELSGLMDLDEGEDVSDMANGDRDAQEAAAAAKKRKAAAARRRRRNFR